MSTPRADQSDENEPQGEPANALFLRGLRALAALSAAIALYALWSVERVQLDCDLQLAAPLAARPGETIALRALVFCDLDALEGPRLVTPTVTVALLDHEGRGLSPQGTGNVLSDTGIGTLDGAWSLPYGAGGDWFLEARAQLDDVPLSVRRPLRVSHDAEPEPVVGREAGPLQQYALGRVRTLRAEPAPDRMLPRVIGGACSPETTCTVVMWVGAPAASIALRPAPNVTLESASPGAETEGLVRFDLKVHGPEAELTFEARRAGNVVAERALRLPIALGEVALGAGASLLDAAQPPWDVEGAYLAAYPPGRSAISVDSFVHGRWAATHVFHKRQSALVRAPDRSQPWLSIHQFFDGAPPPGLIRLQARSDPFSAEGAGARMVYVLAPGVGAAQALAELARTLEAPPWRAWLAPLDEPGVPRPSQLWSERLPPFALADVQSSAAFLLAPAEATRATVPAPSSGRPAQLARLQRTKLKMRYGVAGALALSAWLIGLSIARRGWVAVDQAQAILGEGRDQAGAIEGARIAARARINGRAKVLLMALAVAAAFLAGAVLIASKSLWF